MANSVLPWDQRPDFLAYTDWTPIPGVTSYAVPRNGTGTDVTSFHPGQAFLSVENMPDIMYTLLPCDEWKQFRSSRRPGPKVYQDGTPMYELWTRPGTHRRMLRDFKILPDKISTEEAWWYIEFVRRMDPRVTFTDILMRQEWSVERQNTTDWAYINKRFNTPGYRKYRPAWKMMSWHTTGASQTQLAPQRSVLDALTDAQKNANTTRGSTPGLINPTLGEIPGNRIPLLGLGIPEQRRAETSSESTDDDLSSRSMHSVQALPNVQPTQAPQSDQHRTPQTPHDYWEHQEQEPAQAGSSSITTAPFPSPSTITDSPAARFAGASAASETHRTQAWVDAQALDAAAMPPPPSPSLRQNVYPESRTSAYFPTISSPSSPYDLRNSQFPDPQTFSFQGLATPPPQSTRPTALVEEETPELPSEKDFAKMFARLDEAAAEIDWVSDPVLGIAAVLSNIPPIDPNLAPVEDLELDFMSQAQGENTVVDPNQTQQLQNETEQNPPAPLVQQGTKRNDDDEGNEDLQGVQLDERQERQLEMRMRLLSGSEIPSNQQVSNPNAASSFRQQWQRRAPRSEEYQSPYSQEQSFGGPTPFRAQPLSQASVEQTFLPTGGNPYQERTRVVVGQPRASYSDHHPSIGSPFIPTVATGAQTRDSDLWKFLRIDPADTRPHGNFQTGHMLEQPSRMVPSGNVSQSPMSQPKASRPGSRTDRCGRTGIGFDRHSRTGG